MQTPIKSVCAGTVEDANYASSTYGYYIVVTSNDDAHNSSAKLRVRYSHLAEWPRRANGTLLEGITPSHPVADTVARGEQIGKMGNTGNSTGIHLDMKMYASGNLLSDGDTTNPYQFFRYMRDQIVDVQ